MEDATNSILSRLERPSLALGFFFLLLGVLTWYASEGGWITTEPVKSYAKDGGVIAGLIGFVLLVSVFLANVGRGIRRGQKAYENSRAKRERSDRLLLEIPLASDFAQMLLFRALYSPGGKIRAMPSVPEFGELVQLGFLSHDGWGMIHDQILTVEDSLMKRRGEVTCH